MSKKKPQLKPPVAKKSETVQLQKKEWKPLAEKWFYILLAAFSFLLYINTINHKYVLDDDMALGKNKIVTKGISAIPEIMTTAYRAGAWQREEGLYRPLSLVMFAAEWQIAPDKPFIGHLVNILLYMLTAVVLFRLLRKWFSTYTIFIPFFIAVLYIAHPLHTEVVANIKSRDEILGALFAFLSLSSFYDYAEQSNWKKFLAGTACFLLSILAKESSLTLFAVIPLSIYYFNKNIEKKTYLYIFAALFLTTIIYFLMRKMALGNLVNFKSIDLYNNAIVATDNKLYRFATAIVYLGFYLWKFILPHPLAFDYSYNTIPFATPGDWRFLLSFAILITMGAYAIYTIKKRDSIGFGFLFFMLTISLVSNIVILIEATTADRFMYLPSLGCCIVFIFLMEKLFHLSAVQLPNFAYFFSQKKIASVILTIVLFLFSIKTSTRNFDWKDNFTLFTKDKDNNPKSYRTIGAYANELYNVRIKDLPDYAPEKQALCLEMMDYAKRSLAILPDNFKMWTLLAFGYTQLKDYPQVIQVFEEGKKHYNNDIDWDKFHIMGIDAYYKTQQFQEALTVCDTALKTMPDNAVLWNSRGMVLLDLNRREESMSDLQHALKLDSTVGSAWYNLGNWYARGNDFSRAITYYEKSVSLDSTQLQAYNNMGNCYAVTQQFDKAILQYKKVLSLQPDNPDALRNLSIAEKQLGK